MGSANLIATPMPVSRTLLSSLSFLQIWPRALLARFQQDKLLLALVVLLPVLLWVAPTSPTVLFHLVEWHTVAALTGLMMLSRGLEDSGYLARFAGHSSGLALASLLSQSACRSLSGATSVVSAPRVS